MRHREAAGGAPDLQIHADHWAGWGGGHGREEGEGQVIRTREQVLMCSLQLKRLETSPICSQNQKQEETADVFVCTQTVCCVLACLTNVRILMAASVWLRPCLDPLDLQASHWI